MTPPRISFGAAFDVFMAVFDVSFIKGSFL